MSKTFDQGKDDVAKLCRYFATNQQGFRAPGVKEAHVRQSLIDPFFEALGWDVRNAAMNAPHYREVVPEDSLEIEGQQKAPDYTFRVGTQPKFFAEAKKCGVNINSDPGPAYQLRRYGFSAKVILSILTDFEELGVYDCSPRPRIGDKASFSRIQYFRAEEYPDRWRELWDVFSREAVWSGLYDQYAASKRKRGTSEVDAEFLKEIENWRDVLARNIALRNADLSLDDLNAAVQSIIDRIVFLRMAEDRGIEPYEQLLKLCERPDIYARFIRDLCRKADEKYNSGLFHFQKESGILDAPDKITPNLFIDDKVLKPILQGLYFEFGSPYHFGVMPVEILGTVYERFLGKVIRLTEGHQAKIEEKPEVRKAGGVYYTPSYIVEYIVKNTVGKQIKGKSPAQLAGGKSDPPFRVLDMACGSGSFLLGAYQCLLDHSLSWYLDNKPEAHKKAVYKDSRHGQWRLTIEEKKRLLIAHIFGVDIDPQAVEVSKLSLLLKVLEGETDQTFGDQMKIFEERALPNLSDNIKCGNSLIGPDYFSGKLIPDPEELKRVNPFDWNQAFPEAMKAGGFDCVIGNPPYVFARGGSFNNLTKKYYYQKFPLACYQLNTYLLFIIRAFSNLRNNGYFGYIIPNTWLTIDSFSALRKWLLEETGNLQIINIFDKVFYGANVDTCLLLFQKNYPTYIEVGDFKNGKMSIFGKFPSDRFKKNNYIINIALVKDADKARILDKINNNSKALDSYSVVKAGLKAYETGKGKPIQTDEMKKARIYHNKKKINADYGKYLEGKDVKRYLISWSGWWIKYGECLAAPRKIELFTSMRILVRQIPSSPPYSINAVLTDEYMLNDINSMIVYNFHDINPLFILAVLACKITTFWFVNTFDKFQRKTFPQFKVKELAIFPIPTLKGIDQNSISQKAQILLNLHKTLALARTSQEKALLQRQIDATDREIDQLVYELYGLTKDEIKIVEGEAK